MTTLFFFNTLFLTTYYTSQRTKENVDTIEAVATMIANTCSYTKIERMYRQYTLS